MTLHQKTILIYKPMIMAKDYSNQDVNAIVQALQQIAEEEGVTLQELCEQILAEVDENDSDEAEEGGYSQHDVNVIVQSIQQIAEEEGKTMQEVCEEILSEIE